jgi:hypothetical protein
VPLTSANALMYKTDPGTALSPPPIFEALRSLGGEAMVNLESLARYRPNMACDIDGLSRLLSTQRKS